MFNIGAFEFILLLVIAVIMFGPEKLPEFSRKAARVLVYVRGIANNAQSHLRDELGPEFADLKITDLNPKTFIAKHMQEEIKLLEEARRELNNAEQQIKEATKLAESEVQDVEKTVKATGRSTGVKTIEAGDKLIFDDEAT